mmetsp:Transcript_97768/g.276696  ORF Transcript_97768/g.276696 Transcript_97768/m.276696 type:complete len:326 (-) Transcript_97768:142-1119(-)
MLLVLPVESRNCPVATLIRKPRRLAERNLSLIAAACSDFFTSCRQTLLCEACAACSSLLSLSCMKTWYNWMQSSMATMIPPAHAATHPRWFVKQWAAAATATETGTLMLYWERTLSRRSCCRRTNSFSRSATWRLLRAVASFSSANSCWAWVCSAYNVFSSRSRRRWKSIADSPLQQAAAHMPIAPAARPPSTMPPAALVMKPMPVWATPSAMRAFDNALTTIWTSTLPNTSWKNEFASSKDGPQPSLPRCSSALCHSWFGGRCEPPRCCSSALRRSWLGGRCEPPGRCSSALRLSWLEGCSECADRPCCFCCSGRSAHSRRYAS